MTDTCQINAIHRTCRVSISLLMLVMATAIVRGEEEYKQPFFVGVGECVKCHQGKGMGETYCRWLLSKHSKAYAALARPEAKEITRLSGIPQEPQQAAMCLGCHATGAEAEAWEKDATFHVEDGVQCEKCHGAGSEYMAEDVMMNPSAAREAGLMMPTKADCMNCHKVKGSHVAVLKSPKINIDRAWDEIAHPTPESWKYPKPLVMPIPSDPKGHQYIGAIACGKCHKGPEMGYQFSKWRSGPHARAFAVLGSQYAQKIARDMGVKGNPTESAQCLKCHATVYHQPAGVAASHAVSDGVNCESCHGAGSDFAVEAIMRDKPAARQAGLKEVKPELCLDCHGNAHGKPFDVKDAMQQIAHPTKIPPSKAAIQYKTPLSIALTPDGSQLFVTCEAGNSVCVVDAKKWRKIGEIKTGGQPTDVAFHPSGEWAYVSNRLDDSVSVIHVADRRVIATIPVGDEPHGLVTDKTGSKLFVVNTSTDSISVIDTKTLKEIKRLEASRSPWAISMAPDGNRLLVTNALPQFGEFRTTPLSEITEVDPNRAIVENRFVVPGANLLLGIAWHPSGEYALAVANRTKSLVPMTRLLQGWTITNALCIIWADGHVDQVLLDEPNLCFPDPTDVKITPDGRWALVTSSGSNRVAVIDTEKLLSIVKNASDSERQFVLPNHLGIPTDFIVQHIPTLDSPRGLLITPDGQTAFVANSLDDSLTVIDLNSFKPVARIDLGGPTVITKTRYGERLFHSANITFHRQFSCHTCHPDGHVNGLTFDIEPDGIGSSPVDNRTLRGILDTAPFKWEGTNPSLQRQCGPRLAVFFTRIQPFTPHELSALDTYICTIQRPPNRYRPLGAELTDAQRRGKMMFQRTHTNGGQLIPQQQRCVTCHFPPLYTNRTRQDVGSKMWLDHESRFDVPHLNNIYDSAPYMHNGIAPTLEEIWTRHNPNDQHGVTNDMTKDQLNDLIEYIKTL